MSLGENAIAFQSSPPSSSSGRPAFFAPWKLAPSAPFSRSYCSGVSCPSLAGIDQRAGGAGRIVEQRFVPRARRVVQIDADRRGLERAHAVMVVERVEQRHMQDRPHPPARVLREAHRLPRDRIIVSLGPAVRPRHHLHPVRPQRMQLAHNAPHRHRLEIGVARHHQMPVPGLEQVRPALHRVGLRQQREQRVGVDLALAVEQE
jgi:hypothetical protein